MKPRGSGVLMGVVRDGELKRCALWVGAGLLGLVLVALQIELESVCWDKATVEAAKIHEATSCFDFWLNRYQTLIGAIVAVAAAGAAWLAVLKQVDVARQQIKVMTGDLDPDFFIRQVIYGKHSTVINTVLTAVNLNRRDLNIRCVEVVAPPSARGVLGRRDGERNMHRMFAGHDNRIFYIESRVPGTHPTASEANKAEFDLGLVVAEEERPNVDSRVAVRLIVRLQYEIVGRRAETYTTDVECDLHAR